MIRIKSETNEGIATWNEERKAFAIKWNGFAGTVCDVPNLDGFEILA